MKNIRCITFAFHLISAFISNAQVLKSDSSALVEFFNSTNGPGWTIRTNWLVAGRPVSTWYGVKVVGNRVTQINMNPSSTPFTGNNLVGPLAASIGNLTGLTSLDLAYNKINGSVPSQIGNLVNLTFLNLSNNSLTGAIPTTVNGLVNLSVFLLNNNQLSGPIPSQMGTLTKLTQINLTFNKLTTSIPTSLGNLPNLTQLLLQNNLLTGTIPPQLGSLTNLVSLSLGENQLSGTIPIQLGSLSKLTELNLTTNLLTGSIPIELGNCTNLQFLRLNRNSLSGTVPKELGNLTKLQELLLSENQLTGAVPQELAAISSLSNLQLQFNNFTDLPAFSKTTLTRLNVRDNRLTFEDLEPNMGINNFTYIPQAILPGGATQNLFIGDPFTLSFTVGGSANQHQWKKDGVNKPGNSSTFFIPAVVFLDSGFYELFITSSLVPGLTLQTAPTRLNVSGRPAILAKQNGAEKPLGSTINFDLTDVGSERFKDLEISNTGTAALIISNLQVTGDFNLVGNVPAKIDQGQSVLFTIRFSPTDVGIRTGTFTLTGNTSNPVFTINLMGEGDAELEIFNVVSMNQNGKHDFLHIRNIRLYPKNRVRIYDRWGNQVYDQDGYDNLSKKFTGVSDKGKDLPEGTYYYVIDIEKLKPFTGFLFLRRN